MYYVDGSCGREGRICYGELMDGFWSPSLPLHEQLVAIHALLVIIIFS